MSEWLRRQMDCGGKKMQQQLATCFHAGFLLRLYFFDPEDGGDIFLRNVG
jgi:hypothetical protein